MSSRINIDNRYPAEGEIRTNSSPYLEYAQCMIETFDSIPSFCDIGCATIHIICKDCNGSFYIICTYVLYEAICHLHIIISTKGA